MSQVPRFRADWAGLQPSERRGRVFYAVAQLQTRLRGTALRLP